MTTLFDPLRLGDIPLANRIVMAPLTRTRAPGELANDLMRTYYQQRATAGLIVAEAMQVTESGRGYMDTPGLYTDEMAAAWRPVTDAVHAAGGRIVAQLWHVGRISHSSLQPGGDAPLSSGAVAANVKTRTPTGAQPASVPRVLRVDEIPGIVAAYRRAARLALDAGFDGVEVHGANGYLLEQHLRDSLNNRADAYGGSIANRARLLLEVTRAVADAIGGERTGIRLSPVTPANDIVDANPQPLFAYVVQQLAPLDLAYLHVIEGSTGGPRDIAERPFDYAALRQAWRDAGGTGAWMVNNGYDGALADQVLAEGADLVSFGRAFIANPDLVARLRQGGPFNKPERATFYGGAEKGYTDYPALQA